VSYHDYGPDRSRVPRFMASDDGRTVGDDDFHYDVLFRIDGCWPSDAERIAYAQAVAAALNAAAIPDGKAPIHRSTGEA
jgi:hypothetical protein